MNDADWTKLWNTRFSEPGHAYGTAPNAYLARRLAELPVGSILFGAEGQGRNAVHAARRGWTVSAFDISAAARDSARELARGAGVQLDYRLGALPDLDFAPARFDVVALLYAHFPPTVRVDYHARLARLLKPGGTVIFEGFGQQHLDYRRRTPAVGGPGVQELLFSTEELARDFPGYDAVELQELAVDLREGKYHQGVGSVVRFFGRKPVGGE